MINTSVLKKEMNFLNKQIVELYTDKSLISKNFLEASDILLAYYFKTYDKLGLYYMDILEKTIDAISNDLSQNKWLEFKRQIPTIYKFISIMKIKYRNLD